MRSGFQKVDIHGIAVAFFVDLDVHVSIVRR
jgi:hypothetical protein